MPDQPDDDLLPDEPVPEPAGTPEVVGAARPGRPVGRLVRTGCILLAVIGLFSLYVGAASASDPEGGRCRQARLLLEDEEVVDDADDVDCDDAIAQAVALDEADRDDEVDSLATESAVRTFGLIIGGVGLVQAIGGFLTARLRTKGARVVALAGAALGIVFSPLGLLGIVPLGFVVFAIFFSSDARAVFGEPSSPRLFGPRPS